MRHFSLYVKYYMVADKKLYGTPTIISRKGKYDMENDILMVFIFSLFFLDGSWLPFCVHGNLGPTQDPIRERRIK